MDCGKIKFKIKESYPILFNIKTATLVNLINTSDATITADKVIRGYIGYGKNESRIIGTLDAYSVVQTLLPNNKCRIEVKTLGKPEFDSIITERNISLYKMQDQQRVIREGGELASDEEYVEVEKYLQELYKRIMGVEEDV